MDFSTNFPMKWTDILHSYNSICCYFITGIAHFMSRTQKRLGKKKVTVGWWYYAPVEFRSMFMPK
jgi:hypothetical protein